MKPTEKEERSRSEHLVIWIESQKETVREMEGDLEDARADLTCLYALQRKENDREGRF